MSHYTQRWQVQNLKDHHLLEQQSEREEVQVRDIERQTEVKVCTGARGVDD